MASTTFQIRLLKPSTLDVSFYDEEGNIMKAGQHNNASGLINITWNGTDDEGTLLPAGIYYCRITCDDYEAVKKLIIVR